jgi:hypothetical protein
MPPIAAVVVGGGKGAAIVRARRKGGGRSFVAYVRLLPRRKSLRESRAAGRACHKNRQLLALTVYVRAHRAHQQAASRIAGVCPWLQKHKVGRILGDATSAARHLGIVHALELPQ